MRALRMCALLFLALCFSLAGATRANAQSVTGFSDIWYDDQTGIVTAEGETDVNGYPETRMYGAAVFVQMSVNGTDGPGAYGESCCSGQAYASASVYAADYGYGYFTTTATHTVIINGADPWGLRQLDWQEGDDFVDFGGNGGGDDCFESGDYCDPQQYYYGPVDLGTTWDATYVQPIPVNFRQTGPGIDTLGILRFQYNWDSSTGNLADLSNCVVGEYIEYPSLYSSGGLFIWPSPPYVSDAEPDPTILNIPATAGVAIDRHKHANFLQPYKSNVFDSLQTYRWTCAYSWTDFEHHTIERTVAEHGAPLQGWFYVVTKSGYSARVDPLP